MQKGGMEFAQKREPRQMRSCHGVLFSLKTSFSLCATCFNTHKAMAEKCKTEGEQKKSFERRAEGSKDEC